MVNLPDDLCLGCMACENICPTKAIYSRFDSLGAVYPEIDPQKCIECTLCEKTCPIYAKQPLNTPVRTIAAISTDKYDISSCASGGIASTIARKIISSGGIVYGCSQISLIDFRHIRCANEYELELIKGSKYVQSDISNCFRPLKDDLSNHLTVLFIGTPCQVAAIKSFLRKPYENLITIDLICHGVPSINFLKRYSTEVLRKKESEIHEYFIKFRWKDPTIKEINKDNIKFGTLFYEKKHLIKQNKSPKCKYMSSFFNGYSYRENCHNCQFATTKRVGDMTLGDFWGLGQKIKTELSIRNGVSMILINSAAGEKIYKLINRDIKSEEHSLGDAVSNNKNLSHPTPRPSNKDEFINFYTTDGVSKAVKKCIKSYKKENALIFRIYIFLATKFKTLPLIKDKIKRMML